MPNRSLHSLAVATSKAILPRLLTVTSTVTEFFTVNALNLGTIDRHLFFLAMPRNVTELCKKQHSVIDQKLCAPSVLTVAVGAFWNTTINLNPGILQALHVFLRSRWPSFFKMRTLGLCAIEVSHNVLAVKLALKVHQGISVINFFLLYMHLPALV